MALFVRLLSYAIPEPVIGVSGERERERERDAQPPHDGLTTYKYEDDRQPLIGASVLLSASFTSALLSEKRR